jgi:hypothetical protein
MKPLSAIPLFLLPAFLSSAKDTSKPCSKATLPNPFSPPSDEFCKTNTLGDDSYISIFIPCDFTFYATDVLPNHFSCDAYNTNDDDSTVIKKEQTKVAMWPDSCVATGPRCYSIANNPVLSNFTFYEDTEYHMQFPPDATVVSVDCTVDFAKAEEFLDNLPEEFAQVAASISFFAVVFAIAVIACTIACICGCIIACCGSQIRNPRGSYTEVPPHSSIWKGEPVQATLYNVQPAAKVMV